MNFLRAFSGPFARFEYFNSEKSKFELISVLFLCEMCRSAKTKCFANSVRFCLRYGSTALHDACKSFLAEANAGTLFRV